MTATHIQPTGTPLDVSLRLLADRLGGRPVGGGPLLDVRALGVPDPEPVAAGRLVYPVRLYRNTVLLGPYHRGAGPCPHCLERRWLVLRPGPERAALEWRDRPSDARLVAAAPAPTLTGFALDTAARLMRHALDVAEAVVYELNLSTLAVSRHPLLADPDCPVCGDPVADSAEHGTLTLRPRSKPTAGTYRLRPVGDYGIDPAAYANPVCGALGVTTVPTYRPSATASVVGFLLCRSTSGYHEVSWAGHANTVAASRVYAVLEGLERYAGLQPRGRSATVFDCYDNLKPNALDPLACGVYTSEFYRANEAFYREFTPDLPIHWVWGYSLRDERPLLVPEQVTYYLHRRAGQHHFVQECSSGCASGSCIEEAALHGLLELIERDAFLLTWYTARAPAEIEVSSCPDPEIQLMVGRLRLMGYRARLFDLRADLPVPVVLAVATRDDGGPAMLSLAAGASLDPVEAARNALAETASHVADLPGRVEAMLPLLRPMVEDYGRVRDLTAHATLYGLPEMARHADFLFQGPPARPLAEVFGAWTHERPTTLDLLDDLRYCVDLLAGRGMDVVVVDQTCAEQAALGLCTAGVIVPGLVPIDFGWDRQRVLHSPRLGAALRGASPYPHPHPFP